MIKVEYVLDGTKGELELTKLTGFDSKEAVLAAHGPERISNNLGEELLVDVMAVLKPEVDATPDMYNCQLGGERNTVSIRDTAHKLGFTKLIGNLEDRVIFVIS
ncbi:TPA: hypothetical protein ACPJ01_004555 [Vibrio diabolicus]